VSSDTTSEMFHKLVKEPTTFRVGYLNLHQSYGTPLLNRYLQQLL
jgi:hypothetical protein